MDGPPTWHENETFWEEVRDHIFPADKFEESSEQVTQVLDLAELEPEATVLDVPCGVGRHAVELADRGFDVTAVDATDTYLTTARNRAKERDLDIEFVHEDMRTFRREERFDAVLNLYTSFGYFRNREDDERTAANFYESLKPGGRLVMHLTSKETLAKKFEKRTWSEDDGTYLLEEHTISDDWSWIDNRWIIVSGDETQEYTVSHRLYSAYELTTLLEHVGFSEVTVFGDLAGSAYDEEANALVVLAEK